VAVFNLAIGLGALAGGLVVDHAALVGVLWLAAALFLGAAVAVPAGARRTVSCASGATGRTVT
jgi:predicted MFS family arabinose efflux permease